MAKPKAESIPPAPATRDQTPWLMLLLVALAGGTVGSMLTYMILAPRLQNPAPVALAAASTPVETVPLPDLTAGQPPAQAERTLGNFHYDRSEWVQAAQHYEEAIRLGADDPDIRTDLGNAYQFSNRPADALAQYQLAQKMNPQHEFSLFNQGGLYLERLNDAAKAIETWNEYLRRFPQGRNAEAARQLIAQARARTPGTQALPPPSATPPSNTVDPTEARLMQLVKPKP